MLYSTSDVLIMKAFFGILYSIINIQYDIVILAKIRAASVNNLNQIMQSEEDK